MSARTLARRWGKDVVFAAAAGAILAAGVATTMGHPRVVDPVGLVNVVLPDCDPPQTSITLKWRVDVQVPPVVTGVDVGDVPGECAQKQIVLSLTDNAGDVIGTSVHPGNASPGDGLVAVSFDFSGSPVAAEPIYGVRADVPDAFNGSADVLPGTDVIASFGDRTTGAMVVIRFPHVGAGGGTATLTALAPDLPGWIDPVGFGLGTSPIVFNLTSTAPWTPPAGVCVTYNPAIFAAGKTPRLFQASGSPAAWGPVTTSIDAATHTACGQFTAFGQFALGVQSEPGDQLPTATITSPTSPTRSASLDYTVQFGGPVTFFSAADLKVLPGGATGCVIGAPEWLTTTSAHVSVTGCSDGIVALRLAANSVADGNGFVGPVSAVDAAPVVVDHTAPTLSGILASIRTGVSLTIGKIPMNLTWSGSDAGVGGVTYTVEQSVNGGTSWSTAASATTSTSLATDQSSSGTILYRVRGTDALGNVSAWITGPNLSPRLTQQNSTAVRYTGIWRTSTSSAYSGGSAKYATRTGATASYRFTGRSVGVVLTAAKTRGRVKIYVDGVYTATVDLYSTSTRNRLVTWQKTWASSGTHTVKVVTVSPPGRTRVDLDAFVVVK